MVVVAPPAYERAQRSRRRAVGASAGESSRCGVRPRSDGPAIRRPLVRRRARHGRPDVSQAPACCRRRRAAQGFACRAHRSSRRRRQRGVSRRRPPRVASRCASRARGRSGRASGPDGVRDKIVTRPLRRTRPSTRSPMLLDFSRDVGEAPNIARGCSASAFSVFHSR